MPCCDVAREAMAAADRARRAEAEVQRLHDWIDAGFPPPAPTRPHWAPRTPYRRGDSPWTD